MKNVKKSFGAMFLFLTLLLGCAGPDKETSKDPRIRCAKCAGYYDSELGSHMFNWMQGPGETRR
jgi:hypothetical protein